MDENEKERGRLQAQECVKNLRLHNFAADFFETREEAADFIKQSIEPHSTIGNGGSLTLQQLYLLEWLFNNEEYHYLDRYHCNDVNEIFHESLMADYYLMSSNAVTLDGCLYNVDGRGNRIAALIYGPKKVFVICGVNKIVSSLDEAVERVKMTAAVANNLRLKTDNPCTKTGRCVQCLQDKSICNQFLITRRSSIKDRIHVVLVNEELGY